MAKLSDYAASKWAAHGLRRVVLRVELRRLGSPVRTTVVCPFYVDTGMFAGVRSRFPKLLPILRPEYVAEGWCARSSRQAGLYMLRPSAWAT